MKIGLLGGTFNPPHRGHIVIADEVREKLSLDKILFIPTNIPPHKEVDLAPAGDRLKMVSMAVEESPFFDVLDVELRRGGISYTIDTVLSLKKEYPEDELYLIVGSDLANDFSAWKDFPILAGLVTIVVAQRRGVHFSGDDRFRCLTITHVDISSSRIRTLIREGAALGDYLHPGVVRYIEDRRLYSRQKK